MANKWADAHLKEADEMGIDNIFTTSSIVRRVKAGRRWGRPFEGE